MTWRSKRHRPEQDRRERGRAGQGGSERGGSGRGKSDRGSAAVELPLVIGLVLIPLGLLVLSVPTWIERQHAAHDAAAEASRAVVTGSGDPEAEARAVVGRIEQAYGLPAGTLRLQLQAADRGQPVTARVTVEIPVTNLPVLGRLPAVDWTASHTERHPDLAELRR